MLTRLLTALAWRTLWRNKILLFRAPPLHDPPTLANEISLLHITNQNSPIPEQAMQRAHELPNFAAPRLAQGDQFFALQKNDEIIAFGWTTTRPRLIGLSLIPDSPGRTFFYNFYTFPEHRGQGLYTLLLLAIRLSLTQQQQHDLIIDVNARNKPSLRGVQKAGFVPIGSTSSMTILRRWTCPLKKVTLAPIPPILL